MRLANKTALITGAGSGMGRLAAEMFAQEGAKILATDVNMPALRETVASVHGAGGKILAVECDVTSSDSVAHAIIEGVKELGGLNVLYNNAGIFPDDDTSSSRRRRAVFSACSTSTSRASGSAASTASRSSSSAGGGSVVNIASFVALDGLHRPAGRLHGEQGRASSRSRDRSPCSTARQGVRANAICPGPILTPMLETLFPSEEEKMKRLNRIPLGRFGRAEDIVYAGLYLASDESSWTTGTAFVVDGGITVNYF